jgi:hypothetical protein
MSENRSKKVECVLSELPGEGLGEDPGNLLTAARSAP